MGHCYEMSSVIDGAGLSICELKKRVPHFAICEENFESLKDEYKFTVMRVSVGNEWERVI